MISILLLLSLCSCQEPTAPEVPLEIRFLDVGQGDATLLRTTVGDILIDAGSDAEQDRLCLRLEQLGVTSLELAVFTHSDEDHIGGADGVLRQFPTKTVWISRFFQENEATLRLLSAANDTGAEIVSAFAGTQGVFGETVLTVFSPLGSMEGADDNDRSIVLKLCCNRVSAMLMGDAAEYTESLLLDSYERVHFDSDLLKVGHHGASTSGGRRFLEAVSPKYAVISCEDGNFYGHPHGDTVARLEEIGAEVLRTDLLGDVVFYSDGQELWRPGERDF